jgi:hypothetical protein
MNHPPMDAVHTEGARSRGWAEHVTREKGVMDMPNHSTRPRNRIWLAVAVAVAVAVVVLLVVLYGGGGSGGGGGGGY